MDFRQKALEIHGSLVSPQTGTIQFMPWGIFASPNNTQS
jgi:ABC-type branched-subunit amino acid transport system substrate-binding protein